MIGDYHVIPENDLEVHRPYEDCHCNPTYKDGVWIHHSYDGREVYERHVNYVTSIIPFMKIQTWKANSVEGLMKKFHEELIHSQEISMLDDIIKNRSRFTTLICLT